MTGYRDQEHGLARQAAEARAWRDWNTPVSRQAGSREEAAAITMRLSPDPGRAAALLARAETGTAILRPQRTVRDDELVQIHAGAGRFFQSHLAGSWVPEYLASRGLDAALLPTSPWKIGYAPASWTALTGHLRQLGHSDAAMLCSGLVVNGRNGQLRDHFHDRLMIPLRAEDGVVIAFIGRRHPSAGDDHGPKYLNSPDTGMFTKGRLLAGLAEGSRALRDGAQPILVEGPLDAIAVSIAAPGQFTGISPCGTALTSEQVTALARAVSLPDRGLRIALDADTAGRKAAVRAYARLAPVTSNLTAVTLPDGHDPAEILQKHGRRALRDALTTQVRPLADLVVDARIQEWAPGQELRFAEQQIGALRAAAKVIATMPADQVGQQAARLSARYATRYGWHPEEVTREIIHAIEHRYQAGPQTSTLPPPAAAVITRAIAPPRQRTASYADQSLRQHPVRAARQQSGERE
jgi:DNA primase